jgi:hypothetical protein
MDKKHLLYGFLLLFFVGCGGSGGESSNDTSITQIENTTNKTEASLDNSRGTIKNTIAIQIFILLLYG